MTASLLHLTLQLLHHNSDGSFIILKCLHPLRWEAMSSSLVQLTLQILQHNLNSFIPSPVCFKFFWWPCSLVCTSCFLLFFWFGSLLDADFCRSSSLVSSGFFTVEAAEIPLFLEFRLLEVHFGCSSLVDWSDFLAIEADGEQLVLVAWFLALSCSEMAWCLFPWRWELKVASLWVVTWHTAQAHSFWTFSWRGILGVLSSLHASISAATSAAALSFISTAQVVLLLVSPRFISVRLTWKCGSL